MTLLFEARDGRWNHTGEPVILEADNLGDAEVYAMRELAHYGRLLPLGEAGAEQRSEARLEEALRSFGNLSESGVKTAARGRHIGPPARRIRVPSRRPATAGRPAPQSASGRGATALTEQTPSSAGTHDVELRETTRVLEGAFRSLGLSESAARHAAGGRS